jgi:hypothetical protein
LGHSIAYSVIYEIFIYASFTEKIHFNKEIGVVYGSSLTLVEFLKHALQQSEACPLVEPV